MGANCSNCNCNRDERDHELSIEEKSSVNSGAQKVIKHEQGVTPEELERMKFQELVRILLSSNIFFTN